MAVILFLAWRYGVVMAVILFLAKRYGIVMAGYKCKHLISNVKLDESHIESPTSLRWDRECMVT